MFFLIIDLEILIYNALFYKLIYYKGILNNLIKKLNLNKIKLIK